VCGASSACVVTPDGVADTQGSSDSASDGAATSGADDSSSQSGSTGDTDPAPGSDSDADSDTDTPADDPLADLVAPLPEDPNEQIPPLDDEGCPGIYAQDILPTFELTVDPEIWEQLRWEWDNGAEQEDSGEDHNPYHPLTEFRYGEVVINDAEIRLKGNTTYWDPEDKMQFQIGFHRNDDHGHFLGQRRLAFDAATANIHMLRDRLSLAIMRDMGIDAPCANNARLVVNGEYYGLFTNLEKLDEIFLERVFDDPTGDLWDRHSWELKTNEKSSNDSRLLALIEAETIEELETYLDVEQALQVFAAEAIIPNGDGPWAGGLNFFLYDDPLRNKFVLLPWDLDGGLERFNDPPDGEFPSNPDPVVWEKEKTHGRPLYEFALADPEWFAYYIDSLDQQFESGYAVAKLHARIDTWTAQIQEAVFADTNKWYSDEEYLAEVQDLHDHVQSRHEFMVEWLSCWQDGGSADDDGYCDLP
jgi:spore coat protein CotH